MATTLQKFAAGLVATTLFAGSASAQEKTGSIVLDFGFGWRSALDAHRIDDSKIKGVSCYVTRHTMNSYPDSSELSLSCAQNGPVNVDGIPRQENVFEGNNFRLVRLFDAAKNTVVYVAYSAKIGYDKNKKLGSDNNPATATSAVFLAPAQ